MIADESKILQYKMFFNTYLRTVRNRQDKVNELTKLLTEFEKEGPIGIKPFVSEKTSDFPAELKLRTYLKSNFPSALVESFEQKFKPQNKSKSNFKADDRFLKIILETLAERNEALKESAERQFTHRKNLVAFMIGCLKSEGLHPDILKRDKNKYKRYIVIATKENYFIESSVNNEDCWYFLNYEVLNDQVLFPFMKGKPLLINGKFIDFKKKGVLKIYSTLYSDDEIDILATNREFYWGKRFDSIFPFLLYCEDETNFLLKNPHIVELRSSVNSKNQLLYIESSYINELKMIKPKSFGLSKLIRLCEEINSASINQNYLTLAILQRTLMDYVPPIFGCKKFSEITETYHTAGKSFKEAMSKLEPARKIADLHIHISAQKDDLVPTFTQTNFSQSVDLLLSEIIKILKNSPLP